MLSRVFEHARDSIGRRGGYSDPVHPAFLAHARALALGGRCSACAEPLPPTSLFRGAPCPLCEARADPRISGEQLARAVGERGDQSVAGIAIAVGAAHLLLGWLPLVGAVALIAAAAWIRIGVLEPASRLLSPKRRVLTRWTARLLMAAVVAVTVIVGEALTLIPVVNLPIKAALGAGEVALCAWAVGRYAHWQVEREARGQAIGLGEWLLLAGAVGLLLASVVALVAAIAWLASTWQTVLEWLS